MEIRASDSTSLQAEEGKGMKTYLRGFRNLFLIFLKTILWYFNGRGLLLSSKLNFLRPAKIFSFSISNESA